MKVVIFDDQIEDVLALKDIIIKLLLEFKISYELLLYQTEDELMENIDNTDLLFLDMVIGNKTGIEIGKKIRQLQIPCHIIIITNYSKFAIEGYKIYADHYFLKPIEYDYFAMEMRPILKTFFNNHLGFYDSKISSVKIFYKNILYIEFNNRKTEIHFINNQINKTTYTLSYWLNKLDNLNFSQTHKAYIVNLQYISALNKKNITLFNGEQIPLSRYYKNKFEREYNLYLHEVL